MKMRWRIAFGTIGAVVLAAAVIAAVPSSRAAAGQFFATVFRIDSSDPVKFGYLPEGFKTTPVFLAASGSAGNEGSQGAQSALLQEEQALYRNGDLFLLLKTSTDASAPLPEGRPAEVNGAPAVLQTGLSGTYAPPAPGEGGKKVTASAGVAGGNTVVTGTNGEISVKVEGAASESGAAQAPDDVKRAKTHVEGSGPDIPAITYTNANSLTWIAAGKKVELLTNLPVDELTKIAQGIVVAE